MIPRHLVPTPIVETGTRPKVALREPAPPPRFRSLWVFARVAPFASKFLLRRARHRPTASEVGAAVRSLLEGMGGLWVKLGQLLAMRRDLLPNDFCTEVSRLHDRAVGFPFRLVQKVIEEDLGGPVSELFAEFDEAPLAAASIGQIHRARLRNGDLVAVKIQRPFLPESVARDLALMRGLTAFLARIRFRPNFHWDDMYWELHQAMQEELDYRQEATSIARMRKTLKAHGIIAPRVLHRLCSGRVLTMEFIEGVQMSDYVEVASRDPEAARTWARENGIDPDRAGRTLHISLMRQIFEDNLFHGDLHPGNIMLLRQSKIALIDFGSVGSLDARFRKLYLMLHQALADGQYERVADILSLIAPAPPPNIDWDYIRQQIARTLRQSAIRAYAKNMRYHEKSMNAAMLDVAKSLAGSRIPVGWTFMRVDRAHATLDASLMYLLEDLNYVELAKRYAREAARRGKGAVREKIDDLVLRLRASLASNGSGSSGAEQLLLARERGRRNARVFGPIRQTATVAAEGLLELIFALVAVAMLVLGAVCAAQFLGDGTRAAVTRWLPRLSELVPPLSVGTWLAVFGALTLLALQAASTRARLRAAESLDVHEEA